MRREGGTMEPVVKALKACGPRLMGLPNVVGVGCGHKHVRGQNTGKASLVVLVDKKIPRDELRARCV